MQNKKNHILLFLFFIFSISYADVLVEAEAFVHKGGWVSDAQFLEEMGSPYLMAHGMGVPVENASTEVSLPKSGNYKVWVRTYNWTSPWYSEEGPGAFKVLVDDVELQNTCGTMGQQWMWQEAGVVNISPSSKTQSGTYNIQLSLQDIKGFNGRCDAVLFSENMDFIPPAKADALKSFRKRMLGFDKQPVKAGNYDLIVVGGGTAGCSAALTASRLGLKVALIDNRPFLGGNNSPEVRVGLSGGIKYNYYPKLGNALRLLTKIPIPEDPSEEEMWAKPDRKDDKKYIEWHKYHPHPPKRGGDEDVAQWRQQLIEEEEGISLFQNMHVFDLKMKRNKISTVIAVNTFTGQEYEFSGKYFSDCTGDGSVGMKAGADYRYGSEGEEDFSESIAPDTASVLTMGTTHAWYTDKMREKQLFPEVPWAVKCDDSYHINSRSSAWWWESGFFHNTVSDAERIRDANLRAIYGNWSYLKNETSNYDNYKLKTVRYIGGRRESYRLMGDVILTQNDIENQVDYPDKSFTTTWSMDLHYPRPENSEKYPNEEWTSYARQIKLPAPYHVPYRTLYSRNIDNLFMAGRCISVTHVALGTVRVMATTAMMGEVVGMAAAVCAKEKCMPRDVYKDYLDELVQNMQNGIPLK